MRHTGSKGGVECINIEGDVNRRIELKLVVFVVAFHLQYFHSKSFYLFALMRIDCADSYLDKTLRELLFHDARKRGGMRITISLKVVIKVGMCIEMQNTQVSILTTEGLDDWVGNRMVATKRDICQLIVDQDSYRLLDSRIHCTAGKVYDVTII